jgi:hypothetical protein
VDNLKKGKGVTKLYYNGIPKTLIKKNELQVDKDKLSYAKSVWLQKHGVNILQIDKNSEEESKKLFRYIDYNNEGVI